MASETKPLLIIKTGSTFPAIRDAHGDFEDWFERQFRQNGVRCQIIAPCSGEMLPSCAQVAGAVVTGSPAMVSDRAPWSEETARWLKEAVGTGLPVLGVCYGHQLLAHALGGVVDYHPRGREIGTRDILLKPEAVEDRLFQGLPREFKAQLTHAQSVVKLPPEAVLLASNAFEPHQAFRIGTAAWGVQFHPEFSPQVMREYVETFEETLREEGQDTEGLLQSVRDTPLARSLLDRFALILKEGAAGA